MSDTSTTNNVVKSKPVAEYKFPAPEDEDFDDDISKEEREFYICEYKDLTRINKEKLHCTSCDKHLGSKPKHDERMRMHPMLRTLVCRACHKFYNSGEFERGDDGSELYCRWCGQGGQVYCCASCPIVICAKCVKRNFGTSKVEEIENSDDWNCFKCEPRDLWDLRALCWALLRYCDMKNKLATLTQNEELKAEYEEECNIDESQCCKRRSTASKKKKIEEIKKEIKKEITAPAKKKLSIGEAKNDSTTLPLSQPKVIISPPIKTNSVVPQHSIQVKKFASEMGENKLTSHASVVMDNKTKKAVKRPASPPGSGMLEGPVKIYPGAVSVKKIKNAHLITPPVKINKANKAAKPYTPIAPKPYNGHQSGMRYPAQQTNYSVHQNNYPGQARFPGQMQQKTPRYSNHMSFANDNINLSLESLTQGLDMSSMTGAVSGAGTSSSTNFGINYPSSVSAEDELLCTPDFMEPICEVLEESVDDDVECITPDVTPGTSATLTPAPPPVSVSRMAAAVHNYSPDNIVQMTEQDVTVNKETGGLKFKVDPQTLSSHKMYRLPDGRIFAINVNPNMPGGYSATIVALAPENLQNSLRSPAAPNRVTFPAKITTVVNKEPTLTAIPRILNSKGTDSSNIRNIAQSTPKSKPSILRKATLVEPEECNSSKQRDMKTSVEWLRYNLVDAVDLMEYVLKRLKKIDTNAQISELRTKSVDEMTALHRQLDQLLKTSATRFTEVRTNLDEGLREWLRQKGADLAHNVDEDDDDVEILSDDGRDEPIFIDENSNDSLLTDDQPPKIVSTKSVNSSVTTNDTGSDSLSVDPELNAAATDSLKNDDLQVKDDTAISVIEDKMDSNKLIEMGIRSQIFLEDEDNIINVNNSSRTSEVENNVQKTDEPNNSKTSDDKVDYCHDKTKFSEEKLKIANKDGESIHKALTSVNEDKTVVDKYPESDKDGEMNTTLKSTKETIEALEAVIKTQSVDDEKPITVEDVIFGDSETEPVDEEMTSASEKQDSIDKSVKSVDENVILADEEPKADEDSVMNKKSNSAKENNVPTEVVVHNDNQETNMANSDKVKDSDSSSEKLNDVSMSDELIDNLLGSNDDTNLRSELEMFAESALDTVDLVQPDFV